MLRGNCQQSRVTAKPCSTMVWQGWGDPRGAREVLIPGSEGLVLHMGFHGEREHGTGKQPCIAPGPGGRKCGDGIV